MSFFPRKTRNYDAAFRLVMDGDVVRAEEREPRSSAVEARMQDSTWILKKDLMKSFGPKGLRPTHEATFRKVECNEQSANSQMPPPLSPLIMVYRPFRYAGIDFGQIF